MDYDTYGSGAIELAIELANAERDDPQWARAFLSSHDEWFTPGTSLDLDGRRDPQGRRDRRPGPRRRRRPVAGRRPRPAERTAGAGPAAPLRHRPRRRAAPALRPPRRPGARAADDDGRDGPVAGRRRSTAGSAWACARPRAATTSTSTPRATPAAATAPTPAPAARPSPPTGPARRPDGRRCAEPEAGQTTRFRCRHHGRRAWRDAIHVPRRWPQRRCVERGSDAGTALVRLRRPTAVRPPLRSAGHRARVGHPLGLTLEDDVRVPDRHGEGAPGIARDVAPLPRARSGLEPERAVQPESPDCGHVRAAVLVDGGQPRRAGVRRVRSRSRLRVELLDDGRPVHRRQSVPRTQVDGLHGVQTAGSRTTHRARAPIAFHH